MERQRAAERKSPTSDGNVFWNLMLSHINSIFLHIHFRIYAQAAILRMFVFCCCFCCCGSDCRSNFRSLLFPRWLRENQIERVCVYHFFYLGNEIQFYLHAIIKSAQRVCVQFHSVRMLYVLILLCAFVSSSYRYCPEPHAQLVLILSLFYSFVPQHTLCHCFI